MSFMKSSKSKEITEENPLMLLQAAASLMDTESIDLEKNLGPVPAKKKLKSSDPESSRDHDINEFKEAAANGDLETVNKLLNVKHIHPGVCNNAAVILAAKNGHYHICKRLLEDCRTNPTDQRNYAIRMAVRNGHVEILKLFLDHSKADPSADNNYSIRVASFYGHVEMVKLLLKDPRVDPTVKEYYPIRYAAKNKHEEIVDVLIQDSRVNIKQALALSKRNGKIFQPLIEKLENILINGAYQTPIKIFTEKPLSPISSKPSLYSPMNLTDNVVLYASQGQKPEIETIVKDFKSKIIQAILTSAERGDVEIIKYLLKEFPGLDFNDSDSMALKNAIEKHHLTSLSNK